VLIAGDVRRFNKSAECLRCAAVGWNRADERRASLGGNESMAPATRSRLPSSRRSRSRKPSAPLRATQEARLRDRSGERDPLRSDRATAASECATDSRRAFLASVRLAIDGRPAKSSSQVILYHGHQHMKQECGQRYLENGVGLNDFGNACGFPGSQRQTSLIFGPIDEIE
jgi:hypothetical protein